MQIYFYLIFKSLLFKTDRVRLVPFCKSEQLSSERYSLSWLRGRSIQQRENRNENWLLVEAACCFSLLRELDNIALTSDNRGWLRLTFHVHAIRAFFRNHFSLKRDNYIYSENLRRRNMLRSNRLSFYLTNYSTYNLRLHIFWMSPSNLIFFPVLWWRAAARSIRNMGVPWIWNGLHTGKKLLLECRLGELTW